VRRAEPSTCAEPRGCIVHDAEPRARIRILPLDEHVARIRLVVAQLALAAMPHEIFFHARRVGRSCAHTRDRCRSGVLIGQANSRLYSVEVETMIFWEIFFAPPI
jgi:hypothetical protein